jgi:class 3 adenylate cyclase
MIAVRWLAVILVADVDDYSRIVGEDVAAKAVRERLEAARPILSDLGGRIVKPPGTA